VSLLDRCADRPATELAEYPPEMLLDLQKEAAEAVAAAKAIADKIDSALDLRYSHTASRLRLAAGKDTGSVSFADGAVRVSVEVPKRVEWDQAQLARIAARIRAAGEDPAEFIEVTYRISEAKYGAWPVSMRSTFDAARTLKPGKPAFRLALAKESAQ